MNNVIYLFEPKTQNKKAKCSFCGKQKDAGEYISDENRQDAPVICFDCVRLAKKKLDESLKNS